jgi:hypothetical protein
MNGDASVIYELVEDMRTEYARRLVADEPTKVIELAQSIVDRDPNIPEHLRLAALVVFNQLVANSEVVATSKAAIGKAKLH